MTHHCNYSMDKKKFKTYHFQTTLYAELTHQTRYDSIHRKGDKLDISHRSQFINIKRNITLPAEARSRRKKLISISSARTLNSFVSKTTKPPGVAARGGLQVGQRGSSSVVRGELRLMRKSIIFAAGLLVCPVAQTAQRHVFIMWTL